MNELDIILLIFAAIGAIYGYVSGLINQLTFGAGIILGLLQAVIFSGELSTRVEAAIEWPPILCTILSFIGIMVASLILMKILGVLINAILQLIHLKFVDKILGSIFSVLVAMILSVAIVEGGHTLFPEMKIFGQTSKKESLLYGNVEDTVTAFLSEVKEEI